MKNDLELRYRKYYSKDKLLCLVIHKGGFALYPLKHSNEYNQEITLKFQEYFNDDEITFENKITALNSLNNFNTIYNLDLLPLEHHHSSYYYKNYIIYFENKIKKWVIGNKKYIKLLLNNLNEIDHQEFKTRKSLIYYLDNLEV